MKVVHPKTMMQMDQHTLLKEKITSLALMQRAGSALHKKFIAMFNLNKALDETLILCGPGNNGGDALVIAERLAEANYKVKVIMLFSKDKSTEETQSMLRRIDGKLEVLTFEESSFETISTLVDEADFIIDGIFGIGSLRPIDGSLKHVIAYVNQAAAKVISIDIPSGLDAATGLVKGIAVKADVTFVVQVLKIGNLLHQALDYSGENIIVDAGIDTDVDASSYEQLFSYNYKNTIPSRLHFSHKYQYGNILVFGGHSTMPGAPQLASLAALRSGCGLVTLAVREAERKYFVNTPYEILIHPYQTKVAHLLDKKTAYVFGPGLGNEKNNTDVLHALLNDDVPIIIDGDGIKAFKDCSTFRNEKTIVITPHVGELAQLVNKNTKYILENTEKTLIDLTKKHPYWVVLKGPCTIIAHRGALVFIQAGNPGLAKAGSGDVLSGIIGALLSSDIPTLKALALAVFIHGKAADIAKEIDGEDGFLATDVIDYIPQALAFYKSSKYS